MDLPSSPPLDETEKGLALILFRAGDFLKGKNLRKTSWREIAGFVRSDGPLSTSMWSRLRGAQTREDVLRVLRIIRKQSQRKQSRGGGARSSTTVALKRELATDWQAEVEVDECWNYIDPWCASNWGDEDDHDILTADDKFAYTAAKVLNAYEHAPRLGLTLHVDATEASDASAHRGMVPQEPVELRLSRHVQLAFRRLGDPDFERATFDAVGGLQNLECIKSVVSDRNRQATLCVFAPFWIRAPMDWDGETRFVDHLFVRDSVPEFLYAEWMREYPRVKWLCWFVLLAQNGSLHRAATHFSWQIPRKFQHHLETAPADATPLEATMYAEVLRMGGTETDFHRLRHPAFAVDPTEPSERPDWARFWEETVRWFVSNRAEIRDDHAACLLDWAIHEYTETARRRTRFSWKGRTVRAVVERSQEYRRMLSRPYANYEWEAQGWDSEFELGGSATAAGGSTVWSFVELTTGEALFEEGRTQNHCVAGYASRCVAGHCAIVSVRRDGQCCVTVEISPATRTVLQARGRFNRESTSEERNVINLWLRNTVRAAAVKDGPCGNADCE